MKPPTRFPGRGTVLLLGVLALGGCEAEREEVPEIAEIEAEPDEVGVELDEELLLGPDDVGETFMVNGWVSGTPLVGDGFFLLTEGNRQIFVRTPATAEAGAPVRVTGTLAVAEAAVFEGWEREVFEGELEAEWDVERGYFLDAATLEPLEPGALVRPGESGDGEAPDGDSLSHGDTVSGRG